jgi:glycerol-3-phosphate dehydrogenase
VNAAGPWAAEVIDRIHGARTGRAVRLVKGSHIVVPRLYAGEHAFLLQNPDGRVLFAIPFEDRFTLIGTTDVEWRGPMACPAISDDEIEYLLETLRRYFTSDVSRGKIVWSYSGVRALVDDGAPDPSKVTRDHVLELNGADGRPPLLNVFGGKITTYRHLAEQALDRLAHVFPAAGPGWTKCASLPGGDLPDLDVEAYSARLRQAFPNLPPDLLARFARTYGTRTERLLGDVRSLEDLGQHFGDGLYAREVDYLVAIEWARTAEDVLFRRTKLGLHVRAETVDRLSAYLGAG